MNDKLWCSVVFYRAASHGFRILTANIISAQKWRTFIMKIILDIYLGGGGGGGGGIFLSFNA